MSLTTHVRYTRFPILPVWYIDTELVRYFSSTIFGECTKNCRTSDYQLLLSKDVASVLQHEYPEGIDVAFEGVGGNMLRAALHNLHPQGRILTIGYISQYPHAKSKDASIPISDGLPSPEKLFWKGMTVEKGDQVLMGSALPKVSQFRS